MADHKTKLGRVHHWRRCGRSCVWEFHHARIRYVSRIRHGRLYRIAFSVPAVKRLAFSGILGALVWEIEIEYLHQLTQVMSLRSRPWAVNTRSRPYCLVFPQNKEEASAFLAVLVHVNNAAGDWHIAVKSGSHASLGFNNIAQGVTIALSWMNCSSYDARMNVVHIEHGGRRKDVYANLETYGVTAAGGRDGDVGVRRFLVGGGISYYQAQTGFSCNTIINNEVFLANGTIIEC
jgi:hypothetical protein